MNYDKLLISILTNNKGIIRSKYDRLCDYPNILAYISNRYTDSENLYESIRRMSLKIDIKPLCPICGNPTKYIGKKSKMFSKYCSNSCRAKERANIDRWVEGQKKYNLEHYGVEYVWQREDVKEKRKKKLIDKYETDNLSKVDEVSNKKKQTSISHYGVEHPMKCKYMVQRHNDAKRKNHTFNTSKPEDKCYDILKEKYKVVERQYNSQEYPFNCDFYIPSINTYIECNFSWTHGGHPFNENNGDDIQLLNKWKSKNSAYYKKAIETWTIRDINKRNIAKNNHLNFIEIWNIQEIYNI